MFSVNRQFGEVAHLIGCGGLLLCKHGGYDNVWI